jgi:hypothetical protein
MTTQAKIDANRRNATKSTGPKTAAGKARVSLNALKHGLSAQTMVLPWVPGTPCSAPKSSGSLESEPGTRELVKC